MNIMGTGSVFRWDQNYFLKLISEGSSPLVTDPILLNAFKQVDRKDFLPENMQPKAYEDIDIELAYNEKLARPTFIAQMLSFLKPKFGGKYLDIGTGTGYVAMLLGFVAGDQGKVYTIERVQWFWEQARQNAKKYEKINNVTFLYRDGMEGLINQAPFDGIRVGFALDTRPDELLKQLKLDGGRLVYPSTDYYLKVITRLGKEDFEEELIPGFVFDKGKEGVA